MLLAGDLFTSCGYELNDLEPGYEHTRWTVPELAEYLTGAIAQISALKPTLYASFVPLRLTSGSVQSVPAEYTELIDILYNLNVDGSHGAFVSQSSLSAARALGRPSCATVRGGGYEVRSYSSHPENDAYFFVDPPVPKLDPMPAVWAMVRLAPSKITAATDSVIMANTTPETYREALKDWMLYRAFAKDSESSDSFQKSQAHYKAFMQYVGSPPRDKDAVPVAATTRETASGTAAQ